MKPTDAQLRDAVIRIAAGQSSETDEAARLKVHKSTISRAVKKIGPSLKGDAATAATKTTGSPAAPVPGQKTEKTPLEIAREAAAGTTSAEVSKAVAAAGLEDAKFCIDTLQNYKTAGVYLVAQFSGVPSEEPALPRIGSLSEMAKGVIAQNANWLAPMLRAQGSKEVLYAILGIEALLAYMSIRHLAAKYAPPEEPEAHKQTAGSTAAPAEEAKAL